LFEIGRINPDVAITITVCVQFTQFMAKFADGSSVLVPHKCDEWTVDYQRCSLSSLQKDFAARARWGRSQEAHVSGFDKSTGQEIMLDHDSILCTFAQGCADRRLFLFVDVVDKSDEIMLSNLGLTDVNETIGNNSGVGSATHACPNNVASNVPTNVDTIVDDLPTNPLVVDWDALEIIPIQDDQIGSVVPVVGEDQLYEYIGLRAEDEKTEKEKEKITTESAVIPTHNVDVEGAAIPVTDKIRDEDAIFYDKESPTMVVGSTYVSMNEFRSAVRHHAIKGQFELGTHKYRWTQLDVSFCLWILSN
jgi:hypothetical protein